MNPENELPPTIPPVLEWKDRKGGLIAFGVFEILLGCLQALFVPLMLFGQIQAARMMGTEPNFRQIIPGALFYLFGAVTFFWLGIGSILARRWARALWLVGGWMWLVGGVIGTTIMGFTLPKLMETMATTSPQMPPGVRSVMIISILGILGICFVLIPLALVLFYRSPHVRATCEARDPVVRWTDRCPLPVLPLPLLFASSAVWLVLNPVTQNGVLPWFGVFLSGVPGAVASLILAVVFGYAARASYRLQPAGWWICTLVPAVWCISAALTFANAELSDMYRLMGYSDQQIQQIQQFNLLNGRNIAIWSLVACLAWLGFLFYLKRFFRRSN